MVRTWNDIWRNFHAFYCIFFKKASSFKFWNLKYMFFFLWFFLQLIVTKFWTLKNLFITMRYWMKTKTENQDQNIIFWGNHIVHKWLRWKILSGDEEFFRSQHRDTNLSLGTFFEDISIETHFLRFHFSYIQNINETLGTCQFFIHISEDCLKSLDKFKGLLLIWVSKGQQNFLTNPISDIFLESFATHCLRAHLPSASRFNK